MKPEAFAHASCMCCVQEKERFSLSFQNLNVRGGVKGRTLGTRLKYPKSANNRASLTARIYPQLPRLINFRWSLGWRKLNLRKIPSCYTYNVNRGQVAKIKRTKI